MELWWAMNEPRGSVHIVLFLQSFSSSILTEVVRCRVELLGDAGGGAQHFDPPVRSNESDVVVDAKCKETLSVYELASLTCRKCIGSLPGRSRRGS